MASAATPSATEGPDASLWVPTYRVRISVAAYRSSPCALSTKANRISSTPSAGGRTGVGGLQKDPEGAGHREPRGDAGAPRSPGLTLGKAKFTGKYSR